MITFQDNAGPFLLPTHWHEVSTAQFCTLDRLQCATVEARASYFAGRPIQVNGLVADALAWMLTPPGTEGGLAYPQDLGQETYLQVESIRALLAQQPLHAVLCEVYGVFVARTMELSSVAGYSPLRAERKAAHCQHDPITDTYPAVAHCLAELARLDTKYARLAEPDTTDAGRRARDAGAERLGVYSHLLVAKWFAQLYGITLEAAYQVAWENIAIHLLEARDQAEIMDQLHKNSQHE